MYCGGPKESPPQVSASRPLSEIRRHFLFSIQLLSPSPCTHIHTAGGNIIYIYTHTHTRSLCALSPSRSLCDTDNSLVLVGNSVITCRINGCAQSWNGRGGKARDREPPVRGWDCHEPSLLRSTLRYSGNGRGGKARDRETPKCNNKRAW